MLAVSRALNPECEHIRGDMRDVRLGRLFDAVFIHDAIAYMRTEKELSSTMETAFLHCRPGGGALVCPDYTREAFRPATKHGGHDAAGHGLRYLEWTRDPDPWDNTYVSDMVYLLHEEDRVRCVYDRHVCGLFSRQNWLRLMTGGGFRTRAAPFQHSQPEAEMAEVFLGVRQR